VNIQQKRFAVTSALAASALPALVFARGHAIDSVPEIPLVVANDAFKGLEKTKAAVSLLKTPELMLMLRRPSIPERSELVRVSDETDDMSNTSVH